MFRERSVCVSLFLVDTFCLGSVQQETRPRRPRKQILTATTEYKNTSRKTDVCYDRGCERFVYRTKYRSTAPIYVRKASMCFGLRRCLQRYTAVRQREYPALVFHLQQVGAASLVHARSFLKHEKDELMFTHKHIDQSSLGESSVCSRVCASYVVGG